MTARAAQGEVWWRLARCLQAVVLGGFLLLVLAGRASATPTWLGPSPLSGSGHAAEQPQVAMDGQGDALSAWEVMKMEALPGPETIEAASRPGGALAWQPRLSLAMTDGAKETTAAPRVALDAHGDGVAVWEDFDGTEYKIEASTRTGAGGSWKTPTVLRELGPMIIPGPALAVNASGDIVVVWAREEKFIEASIGTVGGGFSPPEGLSSTGSAQSATHVGIDAAGDATAVWEENAKTGETRIFSSRKPAAGTWSIPEQVSNVATTNANVPSVAVNARGDAVAVWERPDPKLEGQELIEVAARPAASTKWSAQVALTKTDKTRGEPAGQQVAIDGQGDIVVVWSRTDSQGKDVIEASEGRVSAPSFEGPVALSAPGGATEEAPQIAVAPGGSAVVVWERSNGANELIEATTGSAASQAWQSPTAVSAAGEDASSPQVSLDERGDATAVWQRSNGKDPIVEAATYDVGPQLSSLLIPATAEVGQTLSFAVSPLSPIWPSAGTTWSFGDGTGQSGISVTHAFAAAGTYTVSVTSADVLGVSTSTPSTVSVLAPPVLLAKPPAPVIIGAGLSNRRFRVGRRATAISARSRTPQGTRFHFTLSEAASLRIAFTHSIAGLRSGRRCVAPSSRLRRKHAKACRRTVTAGTLSRAGQKRGPDAVAFSGRIGARALTPGAYTAVLSATASGLASAPVSLPFTVLR